MGQAPDLSFGSLGLWHSYRDPKKQTEDVRANFKLGIRCSICGAWHHPDVIHLDYVGHAALTDRLLDADPAWYWEPLSISPDGIPVRDKQLACAPFRSAEGQRYFAAMQCAANMAFINRQGGSGTRVLLDFRLKQLGVDPTAIRGYATEEFTHMSVAVAVSSGGADAGLGIYAAARALDLDFIPVVTEKYDLVIPARHFASEPIQALLGIITSAEFKRRVEALGGYSTHSTGETIDLGAA